MRVHVDAVRVDERMPLPFEGERPTLYADRVGEWYVARKTADHRKSHGLYLTPVRVADFMAKQIQVMGGALRLLDPAAGAGILACAAIEMIVANEVPPKTIELVAYEIDPDLVTPLHAVLNYLVGWCGSKYGVRITTHIHATDFVMVHAEALRLLGTLFAPGAVDQNFDIVIANPPYFKVNKTDPRALAASVVVHGQPNIYGLFMAVSAVLLKPGGDFILITPRSFASGPYFRKFRETFFDMVRPTRIHVFGSRRDAFSRDEVLQESIIFSGIRQDHWHHNEFKAVLAISSSRGVVDMGNPDRHTVSMQKALNLKSSDKVLCLPLSSADDQILALVDSWPTNLKQLNLNISTGPVVPFRSDELISKAGDVPLTHVPLLWMSHVQAMRVTWPLNNHKPGFIRWAGAEKLLVANNNYVLIRRFSAKEEARRLIAAPFLTTNFTMFAVGLENHLNYILDLPL